MGLSSFWHDQIHQAICDKIPEFKQSLSKFDFKVQIEVFKVGGISRDQRTGKLKPIIDKRYN